MFVELVLCLVPLCITSSGVGAKVLAGKTGIGIVVSIGPGDCGAGVTRFTFLQKKIAMSLFFVDFIH